MKRKDAGILTFWRYFSLSEIFRLTNKGLPGVRKGRRRMTTACPLQCNKRPVATLGGPYGKSLEPELLHTSVLIVITSSTSTN